MGCDIHLYLEKDQEDIIIDYTSPKTCFAPFNANFERPYFERPYNASGADLDLELEELNGPEADRNYFIFRELFGVRGDQPTYFDKPKFASRGIPSDLNSILASQINSDEYKSWTHSHTYFYLSELYELISQNYHRIYNLEKEITETDTDTSATNIKYEASHQFINFFNNLFSYVSKAYIYQNSLPCDIAPREEFISFLRKFRVIVCFDN